MKLLLLVQSEADVSHLDAAARAILNSAITGVWVVFSPAITVNASEASAKLDAEIGQLRQAESAAAGRGDYTAAAGYKTQREGRELDRMKEISDAHKKLNAEERATRVKDLFAPFIAQLKPSGLNVRITGHSDHHPREQWVGMLNSLSGVWFKEFVPGSFLVGWPESVETSIRAAAAVPPAVGPGPAGPSAADHQKFREQSAAAVPPAVPQTRGQELAALHPMKLGPIMKDLGLDPEGLGRAEKIAAILAAENPKAETVVVESETADAY